MRIKDIKLGGYYTASRYRNIQVIDNRVWTDIAIVGDDWTLCNHPDLTRKHYGFLCLNLTPTSTNFPKIAWKNRQHNENLVNDLRKRYNLAIIAPRHIFTPLDTHGDMIVV